ncbi:MAG: hypothetical protein AAFV71_05670 [Cyanobacteria bacterium J06633_8]
MFLPENGNSHYGNLTQTIQVGGKEFQKAEFSNPKPKQKRSPLSSDRLKKIPENIYHIFLKLLYSISVT